MGGGKTDQTRKGGTALGTEGPHTDGFGTETTMTLPIRKGKKRKIGSPKQGGMKSKVSPQAHDVGELGEARKTRGVSLGRDEENGDYGLLKHKGGMSQKNKGEACPRKKKKKEVSCGNGEGAGGISPARGNQL